MNQAPAPNDLVKEVAALSGISNLFSEEVIAEAFRRGGTPVGAAPTAQQVKRALPEIARSIRLFLGPQECARRLADITDLLTRRVEAATAAPVRLQIATDSDIVRARAAMGEFCTQMGAGSLVGHRARTIVSELTRNMVSYAGGGELAIESVHLTGKRAVQMIARDRGRGIPNLDAILAGNYKSRTGLGLGILGTKRLADAFEITTGTTGTTVRVELVL